MLDYRVQLSNDYKNEVNRNREFTMNNLYIGCDTMTLID